MRRATALAIVWLCVASAAAAAPRNVGRGISRDGDTLTVQEPTARVKIAVEPGWQSTTDDATGLILLSGRTPAGRTLRAVDRRGRVLGTVTAPAGWVPFATDAGFVLVPDALHGPLREHRLRFLTHTGETRREVHDADLRLLRFEPARGGRFVTASQTAAADGWVVTVYGAAGDALFRRRVASTSAPRTVVTTDGRRVVIVTQDVEGETAVEVFAADRRLRRHVLPSVAYLVADPGSSRVAAVGGETVALVDGESGKLSWRRDQPLGFVPQGGVRFDRRAARLHVVSAERDRPARKSRLRLRSYRLVDGDAEQAPLGDAELDAEPPVVDAEVLPDGERRVVLPERAITIAPGAMQ
jgi:hypothetical protein